MTRGERLAGMVPMLARVVSGFALAFALVALLPVSRVAACSCAPLEPGQALGYAEVAFTGVVASLEDPMAGEPMYSSIDPFLYTFAVEETLKGDPDPVMVIRSARHDASCGIVMATGERWTIYANRQDGDLWTGLCSGNQLLASGVPVPPIPGNGPPAQAIAFAAIAALVLGGVLALAVRRYQPAS